MKNVTVLFCDVDDFCQIFMPILTKTLLSEDKPRKNRCVVILPAEFMTLLRQTQVINFSINHNQ